MQDDFFGLTADSLRAIGYICTNLNCFVFDEKKLYPAPRYGAAPEELAVLLSAWPKVLSI